MYISELRIQNVKRLHAVGIAPDSGEPIILTGDNAQGKSSVLDAIFLALQNKGLEDPIRHGSSKANIKLTLTGDEEVYVAERRITRSSNVLKITRKDGTPIASPQQFLDSLVGNLAFDPLEFVRMKPKAQALAIRELVGLDTSALDARYKDTYAKRTEVNRQKDQAIAQMRAHGDQGEPSKEPDEEYVSAGELIKRQEALASQLEAILRAQQSAKDAINANHAANQKVDELRKQLAEAEAAAKTAKKRADELSAAAEKAAAEGPGRPELEALQQQIRDIDTTNAGIRERNDAKAALKRHYDTRMEIEKKVDELTDRSKQLTDDLQAIEEQKNEMSRKATMPAEGMTFDDDGVLIGGIRFDQLSTAEQVRISAAVAMRGNPKLPIILVREGALLNKANLKAIVDAAKEGNYQIWIEKFQEEPGAVGLHIEDGSITHVDGQPIAQAPEPDESPEEGGRLAKGRPAPASKTTDLALE
jgi:recombinational DNA repair ATPase RecF